MHKITSLFSVGLAALAVQSVTAGIVITPVNSNEGSTLVTTILGSGVTTSNISYVGQNGQAGTFTGGTSAGLGFNSGIVLTTGFANMLPNPQASEYYYISGQQREFGFPIVPGDTDLENLVAPSIPEWWGPIPSYDANSLTFDFSFTGGGGGNLGFTYIFGSDEYPEYVGSFYNDAFAIFLNGNNIATLPGTSIAVAINNVNAGYADGWWGPVGPSNPSYFVANSGQYANILDGFTTAITASVPNLGPGTHTIKFAIADMGDDYLNSAVFIQAGSFGAEAPAAPVPEPGTWAAAALLAGGATFLRWRKRAKAA